MESPIIILVFLVIMVGLMFFQSKKQKQQRQENDSFRLSLSRGDKVMTSSGMLAEIESIDLDSHTATVVSGGLKSVWILDAITKRPAGSENVNTITASSSEKKITKSAVTLSDDEPKKTTKKKSSTK